MSLPVRLNARSVRRLCSFNRISSVFGTLADLKLPGPLLRSAIRAYIGIFNVNMSDVARSPEQFTSFGDFFARELKPGSRPIHPDPNTLVSPCDGILLNFGSAESGVIPQVKGINYSLEDLLQDPDLASQFSHGTFATIYLSPSDYHRVHCPLDGKLTSVRYIPGALFSVSPFFANCLTNLFTTNERIVITIDTPQAAIAVVMVAATIVGRVVLSFSHLSTNCGHPGQSIRYENPSPISKGQELGAFKLGSTVVLLMERTWKPQMLTEGMRVRLGAPIFALPDEELTP